MTKTFTIISAFIILTFTAGVIVGANVEYKNHDNEYVKGYEAALDCRGLMSAPLCEELLKRAGEDK